MTLLIERLARRRRHLAAVEREARDAVTQTAAPAVLLVAALCGACERPDATPAPAARLVERSVVAMGSELRLSAWTADEPAARRAFDAVVAEIERLEARLSVWRAGSDIARVNAEAGRTAVQVSAETIEILRQARQVGDWTGGKFDVTFAALSDLWRFDHDQDDRIPDPREVEARLPLIDYRAVEIDARARTVFLPRRGMRLHLGGIGKGYAVERAAALLRARGFDDFLVQFGGDLYAGGRRGARPWRAGIADPRRPERTFAAVDLSDETLTTSGDYERFFERDGRRYHHILDPDTGQPARGTRSVTIVARRAAVADALSTGVFVLGPAAGMALIERLPDVEGVIVTDAGDVLVSTGLRNRLVLRPPPSAAPGPRDDE
ncbi:MAG TPA: FAD:protein FMN transferase [Vicinamibacterales bacterium]|nr:FAD:protein FMN transferase [Vicinamibacterales bacterium]